MKIDISTEQKKKELYDLFNSFSMKKEIYEYFGISRNTINLNYINELAKNVGFDFNVYKERKKKFCLFCGKELKRGQIKFCSQSCSASYNNSKRILSDDTKEKISKKLRKIYTEEEKIERLRKKRLKGTSKHLKQSLFERGIKENKCEICGITEWQGKPISLQLHHIDGNHFNNNINNLQILCPNCHSQTDNYCVKNRKKKPQKFYCKKCGKELKYENISGLCKKCYGEESLKKTKMPSKETLENDLKELKTYANIAKKYGVIATTVRKWLIRCNLI